MITSAIVLRVQGMLMVMDTAILLSERVENDTGGSGAAYIYYGSSTMDSTADVIMTGEGYKGDFFGLSVAGGRWKQKDYEVINDFYEIQVSTG